MSCDLWVARTTAREVARKQVQHKGPQYADAAAAAAKNIDKE